MHRRSREVRRLIQGCTSHRLPRFPPVPFLPLGHSFSAGEGCSGHFGSNSPQCLALSVNHFQGQQCSLVSLSPAHSPLFAVCSCPLSLTGICRLSPCAPGTQQASASCILTSSHALLKLLRILMWFSEPYVRHCRFLYNKCQ